MPAPRAEKLIVAVLTAINVTNVLDFVLMMPLGPHLHDALKLSPDQIAHLISSYTFAGAASGILGAFAIDRFDRKRAMLALYAVFALATGACALAQDFWSLLAARVVAGACGGLVGSLIFSVIGDVIPYERRGAASGVVMSAFSIASVAGVPVGLALAERFGWHATFAMLAAISVGALALCALALPPMRAHLMQQRPSPARQVREVFADANHRAAFVLNAMVMAAGFSVIPFIALYLVGTVGLTKPQVAWVYFFGGVTTIVTSRLVGVLSDRFGKRRVFIVFAALSMVSTLLLTHLPPVSLPVALVVTTLFIVLGSSRFVPLMALTTAAVQDARRGSFMSVNSAVQSLASALATDVAGLVVVEHHGRIDGYGLVGWGACVALVASIALSLRVHPVGRAAEAERAAGHAAELA